MENWFANSIFFYDWLYRMFRAYALQISYVEWFHDMSLILEPLTIMFIFTKSFQFNVLAHIKTPQNSNTDFNFIEHLN